MKASLKLALRHFKQYPAFSLINLGGLAIGIAASFILLIYSQRELSTDKNFKDADKIARIGTNFFNMGPFAASQAMLSDVARQSCKDVAAATAIDVERSIPVRLNRQDRAFTGIQAYDIDSSFFSVFSYTAVKGSIPDKGLQPGQVILSEANARRFFGSQDPIGKTLLIGKTMTPCTVVAVLEQSFEKSHLDAQLLMARTPNASANLGNWQSIDLYNYVKLKPQGSLAGLHSWLEELRRRVVYPSIQTSDNYTTWANSPTTVSFIVQPLKEIYFSNDVKFDISPGGNLTQVKLLGGISLLLILLSIVNYINLVTARSSVRAKEIGMKKTFGASRRQLIAQILQESVIFSALAMLLACGLIQAILFLYQYSTGAELTGPIPFLSANYIWLALFSLLVGFLAGAYPALYLTGMGNPLVIRSTSGSGKNNARIRNGLVVLQFVIATGLLFVSFVVYSQLQYMKNKDKGFRSEGLLLVENIDSLKERVRAFQKLVETQAQVVATSFCQRTPGGASISMGTYKTSAMPQFMTIQEFPVDDRYIETMGMHLMAGRNFQKDLLSDTNSLILNESAVAALGLFDPVGKLINGAQRVIGVVKDFNYSSFHEKIGPAILKYSTGGRRSATLAIRLRGGNTTAFINWLQKTGKEFMPDDPLRIVFLDDNFARLSRKEELLGKTITFFTILAISLATLGLIGLTLFTIERRTKEIGIRKVLGADRLSILRLVSKDFIRLALIASLIALPTSWWLINRWLNNFAYRIRVGAGLFMTTEALILALAFVVIALLTLKTLAADPVKNLRSE